MTNLIFKICRPIHHLKISCTVVLMTSLALAMLTSPLPFCANSGQYLAILSPQWRSPRSTAMAIMMAVSDLPELQKGGGVSYHHSHKKEIIYLLCMLRCLLLFGQKSLNFNQFDKITKCFELLSKKTLFCAFLVQFLYLQRELQPLTDDDDHRVRIAQTKRQMLSELFGSFLSIIAQVPLHSEFGLDVLSILIFALNQGIYF